MRYFGGIRVTEQQEQSLGDYDLLGWIIRRFKVPSKRMPALIKILAEALFSVSQTARS